MKKLKFYQIYAIAVLLGICTMPLQATIVYVTPWGGGNGSSWSSSLSSVQDAIVLASISGSGSVWISSGTYYPSKVISGNLGSDTLRSRVFELYPGVSIYGGFKGDETSLDQRQWQDTDQDGITEPWELKNPTILSAERGNISDYSDNYYHVIYGISLQDSVTLDGLVIEGGYADDYQGDNNFGGGMAIFNGNQSFVINIRNCEMLNNYSKDGGACCWYSYSQSHLDINVEGSRFAGNSSNYGGAGVAYVWSSSRTDLSIEDSEFDENSSSLYGGAIMGYTITGTDTVIINSTRSIYTNNRADYGGALSLFNTGGMAYCKVEGAKLLTNKALKEGGAVALFQSGGGICRSVLFNNLIVNNEAVRKGGAFYSTVNSGAGLCENYILQNTVVNNKAEKGGGLYLNDYSTQELNRSVIVNNILWGNDSAQTSYVGGKQQFVANAIQAEDTVYENNIGVDSLLESLTTNSLWFVDATNYIGNADSSDEVEELLGANWHMNSFSVALDSARSLYIKQAIDESGFKDKYYINDPNSGYIYNLADSVELEELENLVLLNNRDIDAKERDRSGTLGIDIGAYETPLAKAITDTVKGVSEFSFEYLGVLEYLNSDLVHTGCVFSTDSVFNPYLPKGEITIASDFPGKFTTIIGNLDPGTTYYLRSKAFNDYGDYFDKEWSVTTKCEAPILEIPEITNDSTFVMSWGAASGAIMYQVKVAVDMGFDNCIEMYCDSMVVDTFIIVALPVPATQDDDFYIKVAAVNSDSVSGKYSSPEVVDYSYLSVNDKGVVAKKLILTSNSGIYQVVTGTVSDVVVYNVLGEVVWQFFDATSEIDIGDLVNGVYIIHYQYNNLLLSQKVVLR